jgi:RNA recognition motif-containing protein
MDSTKSNDKKIYVSNIPKHVDSKQLQKYFESFGSVYSAVVIGAKKGKSLSYGFVSFSSKKSLDLVLNSTHSIDGCMLSIDTVSIDKAKNNLVKYANGEDSNVFLFVQDIPKDVNRQVLVDYFAQFGELTKARLVNRPDKNKDFIYLQYKTIDSAANAKSQKHKIVGLSKENITLVCKVGIFKNQKQIQIMEEAEDLLAKHRPAASTSLSQQSGEIDRSRKSVDISSRTTAEISMRPTKITGNVIPELEEIDQSDEEPAPPDNPLDQESSSIFQDCVLENKGEPAHIIISTGHMVDLLFRECALNEEESNYRFNRQTELHPRGLSSPGRSRANRHINFGDILLFDSVEVQDNAETAKASVGAIGSHLSTPVVSKVAAEPPQPVAQTPQPKKKASLADAFRAVRASLRLSYK